MLIIGKQWVLSENEIGTSVNNHGWVLVVFVVCVFVIVVAVVIVFVFFCVGFVLFCVAVCFCCVFFVCLCLFFVFFVCFLRGGDVCVQYTNIFGIEKDIFLNKKREVYMRFHVFNFQFINELYYASHIFAPTALKMNMLSPLNIFLVNIF